MSQKVEAGKEGHTNLIHGALSLQTKPNFTVLLGNASGELAEHVDDAGDGDGAAAGALADGGAHGLELRGVGQDLGRVLAVEVGQAGHVSSAALGRAVESRAGRVGLALEHGWCGHGGGEEGGESEELHFCFWVEKGK
jgi:hypothetical protein